MPIPKTIHYCWFGGNPLPELAKKCIASWKRHCPDYEFTLWNEENFDVNITKFTKEASISGKWAFVSDFLRFYVIYYHGGIFLDVDVELLKPFDDKILLNTCFSGFESDKFVNPGNIFAGEKECNIAKELIDFYESYKFIKKNTKLNFTPSPQIFTAILLKYGLKQNNTYQELEKITVYPTEYFCVKDFYTGLTTITGTTYSIHHFASSWVSDENMKKTRERWDFYSKYGNDQYLVNIFESYNNLNINDISLKQLYKIGIHRTVKKIISKIFARKLFR